MLGMIWQFRAMFPKSLLHVLLALAACIAGIAVAAGLQTRRGESPAGR
ncbi:MAG: hypothetical protein WDN24_09915 [Sphingomonas sp.]